MMMPPWTGSAPNWGKERTVVGLVLHGLRFYFPQSVSDLERHRSSLGFSHWLPWTLFFTPWHTQSLVWELPPSVLHLQGINRECFSGLLLERYLMRTLTSQFYRLELSLLSPLAKSSRIDLNCMHSHQPGQRTVHQSHDQPTAGRAVGHIDTKVSVPETGFWFFVWNANLWIRSDSFIK